MKKYTAFDLNQPIKDIAGKEIKLQMGVDLVTLQVKEAFRMSLSGNFDDEKAITFEEKIKRFKLSEKMYYCNLSIELSTEEQAELKKCVIKLFLSNIEALGFLEKIIEGLPIDSIKTNGEADFKLHKQFINSD